MQLQELVEEFRSVVSGKTLDAILPPLVFVVLYTAVSLSAAVLGSMGLAVALNLNRIRRGQLWYYALGGLVGAAMASLLALVTQSAANYFLPGLVSSALLFAVAAGSMVAGRPMIAWVSHLTRGWPLDWFWRDDVRPAYNAVTAAWAGLFAMRLVIQLVMYLRQDVTGLAWANLLMGWPLTLGLLVFTYVYGIRRLRQLGGPGVDEFAAGTPPPWRGQVRGF